MPTRRLKEQDDEAQVWSPPVTEHTEQGVVRVTARDYAKRVRRLKLNLAAWVVGTVLLTALWVLTQWNANGGFERFAHEGNAGDWNPTLWALTVGVWGLVVGIMALRVHFERPVTTAEVDGAVERLRPRLSAKHEVTADEIRAFARRRLEGVRRLRFHVAAWVLGMVVVTPLNALIEWQDNGNFERFSNNSQPGSWDPWVLQIGGIWALAIAALALIVYVDRPKSSVRGRHLWQLRSSGRPTNRPYSSG